MKINNPDSRKRNGMMTAIFLSVFLTLTVTLNAQTPADFSGKWVFDKTASDRDETGDASFTGTIILEIRQDADTVSFSNTYIVNESRSVKMPGSSFLADGGVLPDNSGTDPAKKFIKWSQDRKTLTTNYIMTASIDGVAQDFLTATTYSLSADGKTLTAEELKSSKLNGDRKVKKIYRKK
ncbi:MAG TPA: hypothetical protein VHO46_02270 [Bacteroidales bacterium]|nr:hypothetical protein [Bacteroidales bacterium]